MSTPLGNEIDRLRAENNELRDALNKYTAAEEAGTLLWLPVPLGTPVYDVFYLNGFAMSDLTKRIACRPFRVEHVERFGKTVFLTQVEAENAKGE